MDYGKYKYEQDQRRKESKRKASNVVIKEMKFRPKIDGHDYDDQDEARRALPRRGVEGQAHDHVPWSRDGSPRARAAHPGTVAEQVGELAIIESSPKHDGRNMTMVLNPTRRPKGKGQGATKGAPKSGGHGSDDAGRRAPQPSRRQPRSPSRCPPTPRPERTA